jgi:hypothetical protein
MVRRASSGARVMDETALLDFESGDVQSCRVSSPGRREIDRWPAADCLLWSMFVNDVLSKLPPTFRFCEVGGGRWAPRILAQFAEASGVVYSTSPTVPSIEESRSLQVVSTEWDTSCSLADRSFDVTFAFRTVLDRAADPFVVVSELVRITRPGGFVAVVVSNLYGVVSDNLASGRPADAETALRGRGTIGPGLPTINLFTPELISTLLRQAGAYPLATLGLGPPVSRGLNLPGLKPDGSYLSLDGVVRDRILAIEELLARQVPQLGADLLSIGQIQPGWGTYW